MGVADAYDLIAIGSGPAGESATELAAHFGYRSYRKLLGVHCIGDIASELVGVGQMAIRCHGTIDTIANMSMNTPTYAYAYKYAAFDGLRRIAAAGKESLDESAKRPSANL